MTAEGASETAAEVVPTRGYQIGDVAPKGPMPGQCAPGCQVLFPTLAGGAKAGSAPCWQFASQIACEAAAPGWLYAVPACGETELWLSGCIWLPASGCGPGEWFVAWQGCA